VLAVADNPLEAPTMIVTPGVLPASIVTLSFATAIEAEENRPDFLDLITFMGEAGTYQITLNATSSDPTSGAVKINWNTN